MGWKHRGCFSRADGAKLVESSPRIINLRPGKDPHSPYMPFKGLKFWWSQAGWLFSHSFSLEASTDVESNVV